MTIWYPFHLVLSIFSLLLATSHVYYLLILLLSHLRFQHVAYLKGSTTGELFHSQGIFPRRYLQKLLSLSLLFQYDKLLTICLTMNWSVPRSKPTLWAQCWPLLKILGGKSATPTAIFGWTWSPTPPVLDASHDLWRNSLSFCNYSRRIQVPCQLSY